MRIVQSQDKEMQDLQNAVEEEFAKVYRLQANFLSSFALDSKPPRIAYSDASSIAVSFHPLETTARITLQDGIQRTLPNAVTFSFGNGRGEEGSDDVESSTAWYHLYLIPRANVDEYLTVIASESASHPIGYSNYRYIGAFHNKSGNIEMFYQVNDNHFLWNDATVHLPVNGSNVAPYSSRSLSISSHVPSTAKAVDFLIRLQADDPDRYQYIIAATNDVNTLSLYAQADAKELAGRASDLCAGMVPLNETQLVYEALVRKKNISTRFIGWDRRW
jgi:hypothetical protein